jgi:chromosomal replication initiation ATPase DnaA
MNSDAPDYDHLAHVFIRAYADAGNVAGALRVLDEYREIQKQARLPRIDVPDLLRTTGRHLGVPAQKICGSRHRYAFEALWVVAKILRDHGWSTPKIGSAIGVDHSSVHHALSTTTERPDLMAAAKDVVDALQRPQRRLEPALDFQTAP